MSPWKALLDGAPLLMFSVGEKKKAQGGWGRREWQSAPGAPVPAGPPAGTLLCPLILCFLSTPAPRQAGSSLGSFLSVLGMRPH